MYYFMKYNFVSLILNVVIVALFFFNRRQICVFIKDNYVGIRLILDINNKILLLNI